MKSNLILVKLSTAVVDVKVDKDSFLEEIELDPYDQFGGNSSVEDSNFFIVNVLINVMVNPQKSDSISLSGEV